MPCKTQIMYNFRIHTPDNSYILFIVIKLGSGELERISLDHGTLTRLGYQPLRGW